jgi:hypothetical protein
MVRQPQNLAEAKQIFQEEKTKVTSSIAAIAGSRWLTAILATLALSFGTHVIYAPTRLPTVERVNIAQLGLPTNIDFGVVGEQAKQAAEAAQREGAGVQAQTRFAEEAAANADFIPMLNKIAFAVALVLLLINMTIMTRRRRYSRG